MDAPPPPLGVSVATSARHPGGESAPSCANVAAPLWPRSAQVITACLLLLALVLLSWHVALLKGWGMRPTTLVPGALENYRIDLNRADRAQLLQLPGIGDALAQRIDAYRRQHRGFRNVDELRRVPGIGSVLLEQLRPLICVEPYEEEEEEAEPARPVVHTSWKPDLTASRSKKRGSVSGAIDVNQADARKLRQLPGIGPKLSERIIEARQRRPFRSVDDLRRVPGIGPKKLEQLRPYVTVGKARREESWRD